MSLVPIVVIGGAVDSNAAQYAVDSDTMKAALPTNLEILASAKMPTQAASLDISNLPLRDLLYLLIRVKNYAQADTVSLQFNGDVGGNYSHRWLSASAGGMVFDVDDGAAPDTLIELAGKDVTTGRSIEVQINNFLNAEKICRINTMTGTGANNVLPYLEIGGGSWINTTEQVNRITMVTAGGHFFQADMMVFGRNF